MDLNQAINVFTKTLMWKLTEGHGVEDEEIAALNELRTSAGLKPLDVPAGAGKKPPQSEKPKSLPQGESGESFHPTALAINGRTVSGQMLPDNAQWTNRFDIKSESSGRLYRIAQNKTRRYWGCTCPGWISRRNCKHLRAMGLPGNEQPFEARLTKGASDKTASFGDDSFAEAAHIIAADMIHSDAELSKMMEPIEQVQGEAHIEGPEAGPSNDELRENTHEESGVPVTDGDLKSPERQNTNAMREALETQVEMEVGKPIEQKQEEVAMQEKVQDAALAQGAGGLAGSPVQEVSAKPGTQIIINVGSKEAALQKVAYVEHMPGHKNSKGEDAPWVIKQHESGKILSSHKSKGEAESHLQDMHAHAASNEGGAWSISGVTPNKETTEDVNKALKRMKAGQTADWCDACIFKLHPEILMSHAPGHGQVGKCERCGNNSELRAVKVPMEKHSAEPIGGENQPGATSGKGGGMFGGTDLEGPSFKTDFKVGFTFRGTEREASFTSFKEASAFIKHASAKFGKIAGDWVMKCPNCKGQATKNRREDSYQCSCGWNSGTGMTANDGNKKKQASKTAAVDPAKRNLVLELLKQGPKTTGEIEKGLGGGKYTNMSWHILQELAKEGLVGHKKMRWSLKTAAFQFRPDDWESANDLTRSGSIARNPRILVEFGGQVYGTWSLDDSTLLDAVAWQNGVSISRYDDWMRQHAGDVVTIAIRGKAEGEQPKVLEYKLGDFPAVKKLLEQKVSSKKAAFGKKALSIETRISAAGGADVLQTITDKLNVFFADLKQKNPQGFMDSFEQQLPSRMMDIAQDMNLQMDYVPEGDTYIFYDQVAIGTRGKKFEEFEKESAKVAGPTKAKRLLQQAARLVFDMKKQNAAGLIDMNQMEGLCAQHATAAEVAKLMVDGYNPQIMFLEQKDADHAMCIACGEALAEYRGDEEDHVAADKTAEIMLPKGFVKHDPENKGQAPMFEPLTGALKTAKIRITSVKSMPQKGSPEWHQLQIAIQTMKMPDPMVNVMGGPDREESERVLAQYGLQWDEAAYLKGGQGVKKMAGDGMAKTEEQVEKEAGFNFFFPGQVVKEFYPELQHEIVDYPNSSNQAISQNNPEIVGDGDPSHELEGVLDEALDHGVVEMIQLPADVGEVEPLMMAAADYSSTSPASGMGIGRDGKPEVLEGVPLRKENDVRGYMFTDEFYGQYEGVPGAAMNVASKTAAEGGESKQFALFLKKVCGEIAATMVAAFKVTSRPLLDKVPGMGELQLDTIEQGSGTAMPLGQTSQGGRVKYLMGKLNDSDIKSAINDAWAQAAVWNDSPEGGFVYEVFVRPETIDTDSLVMKYKFVCGTRE